MNENLINELKNLIKGDVLTDKVTLKMYSHDASLFEVKPHVVVFPKDEEDVKSLVRFVAQNKKNNPISFLNRPLCWNRYDRRLYK